MAKSIHLKHCFNAAHRLSKHRGKCQNMHGHTWIVDVTICPLVLKDSLNEHDMIVDYGNIKEIIDKFDHCSIVNASVDMEYIEFCKARRWAVIGISRDPTSEVLAQEIKQMLEDELHIRVLKIKVWEKKVELEASATVTDK